MSSNKTQANQNSVEAFIENTEERYQEDCKTLCQLMSEITGSPPKMWGDSLVGFGQYDYKYASGREGSWFLTGFSPRKQNLTIYIMPGFEEFSDEMSKLGKHKTGKSCLYVKSLATIEYDVLAKMIQDSVEIMRTRYNG